MSEETIVVKNPGSRRRTWIIRGVLWSIVIQVFSFLSGCTVPAETPVHFVLGWFSHAVKALPPLLGNWRPSVVPLGCLLLASWLLHRFVRWWQVAKGKPPSWRVGHTISAVSLLLLGCGAAIALSGVVHQAVWLMSDPWTENRGRNSDQTAAVSNARQLVLALWEFHDSKGRYPNSLRELETELDLPSQLAWVQNDFAKVREPFILLHPGGARLLNPDEPLIVSPVLLRVEKIVVGYGDGSVRSLPAGRLGQVLRNRGLPSPPPTPARE